MNHSVEIYKSVAPLQHVIEPSEDFARDEVVLAKGTLLTPQALGLAAGLGYDTLKVFRTPKVGIISTGDEVISVTETPVPGKIRDINSYSLAALVEEAGACVTRYGIVKDDPIALKAVCEKAIAETDMVMISGGSSVGTRDFTVEVLSGIPDTEILVHCMSVSPGKPTILAKSFGLPVWGLPGQVVSAMVVVKIIVIPFLKPAPGPGCATPPEAGSGPAYPEPGICPGPEGLRPGGSGTRGGGAGGSAPFGQIRPDSDYGPCRRASGDRRACGGSGKASYGGHYFNLRRAYEYQAQHLSGHGQH